MLRRRSPGGRGPASSCVEKLLGLQPVAARDGLKGQRERLHVFLQNRWLQPPLVLTEAGGIGQREPWPQGPTGKYKIVITR